MGKEGVVQSTDLEEIKAAIFEQAYHPCTRVSWGVAQVMAVRCRKGQLLALLRGQGRWYPVESVTISRPSCAQLGRAILKTKTPMNKMVNDLKCRSYTHLVNQMLQSYEDTARNRCESGWTFSMQHADELLSPNVCKNGNVSSFCPET
jgi:hypothetical protein